MKILITALREIIAAVRFRRVGRETKFHSPPCMGAVNSKKAGMLCPRNRTSAAPSGGANRKSGQSARGFLRSLLLIGGIQICMGAPAPSAVGLEAPVFTAFTVGSSGGFQCEFTTVAGTEYVIERSLDLTQWTSLAALVAVGDTTSFMDSAATGSPMGFYRVQTDQVFSVNLVGFINRVLQTGTNYISNPLYHGDNSVATLFPRSPTGSEIYQWNGQTLLNTTLYDFGTWIPADIALPPGEGFILNNPGPPMMVTFIGEVPQGRLVNPLPAGRSLQASIAPVSGMLNFPAENGDVITTWEAGASSLLEHQYFFGSWEPPLQISPGESFWLQTETGRDWVQNFLISAPASPPTILTQPQNLARLVGQNASFSISATGTPPLNFQWRKGNTILSDDEVRISGSQSDTLTILNCRLEDAGQYSVVVSNSSGEATSEPGLLTVNELGEQIFLTDYYPLAIGNRWIYSGTDFDGTPLNHMTLVFSEAESIRMFTGRETVTTYLQPVTSVYRATGYYNPQWDLFLPYDAWIDYESSDSGLAYFGTDNAPGDEQYRVDQGFVFGDAIRLGQSLSQTRDAYESGEYIGPETTVVEVLEIVDVTVPAGTFADCLHLRFRDDLGNLGFEDVWEEWWAPGVGPVRYQGDSQNPSTDFYELIHANLAVPLQIERQPEDRLAVRDTGVVFQVEAVGTEPLNFQWRRNGVALMDGGRVTGATTRTLTLLDVQPQDAGDYDVIVRSAGDSETSRSARLTVYEPVTITANPRSWTVVPGTEVTLIVAASGTAPLNYQWWFNGRAIDGANRFNLDLGAVDMQQAGEYSVVVSHEFGNATSTTAEVVVVQPPVILAPPESREPFPGEDFLLQVEATGAGPLTYQWRRNGNNLPGATGRQLGLVNFQPTDGGLYSVVVANPFGAVESAAALIRPQGVSLLPMSDLFGERSPLEAPAGVGLGSNLGAGREPGEPRHAGKTGNASVWLSWLGNTTGVVRLNTAGSTFDTLLAVYEGSNLAGLANVASNEDQDNSLTSAVQFFAQAGVEYPIAIDGFNGAEGDVVLSWSFTPEEVPPPRFESHPQGQVAAPDERVELNAPATGRDLVWQWLKNGAPLPNATAPTLILPAFGLEDVGLYQALVEDDLGRTALSHPARLELGSAGQVLSVTKLGDLWEQSPPSAAAILPASRLAPQSFQSVSAGVLGEQWLTTAGAVNEHGEKISGDDPEAAEGSIWYGLVPEADGVLFLDTQGSMIPATLSVRTGRNLENQAELAVGSPAAELPGVPRVALPVIAGQEYAVAIVARADATGGSVPIRWRLAAEQEIFELRRDTESFYMLLSVPPKERLDLMRSPDMLEWEHLTFLKSLSGMLQFSDQYILSDSFNHRWFYRLVPKGKTP